MGDNDDRKPHVVIFEMIDRAYSAEDLRQLCFYLDVDYDDLDGGDNKRVKARSLVEDMKRVGRLEELIAQVKKERPKENFTLLTPAATLNSAAPDKDMNTSAQTLSVGLKTEASSKMILRVLWVDDALEVASNQRSELQRFGVQVVYVMDNRDAFRQLLHDQVNLVVTDIERATQITDGMDLVAGLHDINPNIPVIVYLDNQEERIVRRLRELGAFSTANLQQLVNVALIKLGLSQLLP